MKRSKEKGAGKGLSGGYLEDGDDDDSDDDDATISIAKIKNKYKSGGAAQQKGRSRHVQLLRIFTWTGPVNTSHRVYNIFSKPDEGLKLCV